jgi:hypothetical protein
MERSLIDQLVPARDVGLAIHGQKLLGDRLDYAMSVSNGQINGDMDTNDSKDVNGRIALRPFRTWASMPGLQGLQIGISAGAGIENEPIAPNTLRTPAGCRGSSSCRAYRPTACAPVEPRSGLLLRAVWVRRPVLPPGAGSAAERYEARRADRERPCGGVLRPRHLSADRENRTTYSEAITPLRPFDPRHPCTAPGAWELVLRLSRLRLGDDVFAPGAARLADPSRFSNGASELTAGFNWYLNRWVRTQFNWEHAWFDEPVQLGTGPQGRLNGQDTLMARFQIIF